MAASLSASLEDYLEAIFHIVQEKPAARAKDTAPADAGGAIQGAADSPGPDPT